MNGVNGNLAQATRGPVLLITLGSLIALDTFHGIGFSRTWPALLIVFGVFKLLERLTVPPAGQAPTTTTGGGA